MLRANFALADSATSSYELMKYVNTLHEFHPDEIEPYLDYGRIYDSCLVKFPITSGSLSAFRLRQILPFLPTTCFSLPEADALKKEIRERVMKAARKQCAVGSHLEDGKAYLAVGKLIVSDGQERIQKYPVASYPRVGALFPAGPWGPADPCGGQQRGGALLQCQGSSWKGCGRVPCAAADTGADAGSARAGNGHGFFLPQHGGRTWGKLEVGFHHVTAAADGESDGISMAVYHAVPAQHCGGCRLCCCSPKR